MAQDEIRRLHRTRKLVLLVDLDQTIIHTTQHRPKKLTKNTISFQLTENEPWLWTRLRPNCCEFIRGMSKLYEMHIGKEDSRNLMVLLTSAILGARTADRPADGTFFLQKKNYRMAKT